MTILMAFETVFDQCSVALLQDGELLQKNDVQGKRGQTEIILPMIDDALKARNLRPSDVDVFAFTRGPGAFSGIRVGAAVAHGLALASDALCVGVSSLQALAYAAHSRERFAENTRLCASIDARQNQVYVGHFCVQNRRVCPDLQKDAAHESLVDHQSNINADVVVGDAHALCGQACLVQAKVDAADIARLAWEDFLQGKARLPHLAQPVYLRNNAWKTLAEQSPPSF